MMLYGAGEGPLLGREVRTVIGAKLGTRDGDSVSDVGPVLGRELPVLGREVRTVTGTKLGTGDGDSVGDVGSVLGRELGTGVGAELGLACNNEQRE